MTVEPGREALDGYDEIAQSRYAAWRRKNQRDELPEDFSRLLDRVISFADPALDGEATALAWRNNDDTAKGTRAGL